MPNLAEFEEFVKTQGGNEGLAVKMKVAPATVSAWRTGRNNIKPEYKRVMTEDLGYAGRYPDEVGGGVTREDFESLREEFRTQVAWLREELRKENKALAALLQQALKQLGQLPENNPEAPREPTAKSFPS